MAHGFKTSYVDFINLVLGPTSICFCR
ncbi:hypothetical protein NXW75_07945 [Bacteroides xylanisolvens]|nr:hypothetical protein [Bacteroides xylanisolvens]